MLELETTIAELKALSGSLSAELSATQQREKAAMERETELKERVNSLENQLGSAPLQNRAKLFKPAGYVGIASDARPYAVQVSAMRVMGPPAEDG